eukprot:TRINITY_DN9236_c0_g1_i2.p1 TRINITY_DN9236_c0_g1~~TRINITY_DN9236_c0_g1_i2.p1  ORF type:complete len:473 (-),score=111.61 TRINITY_DN9236_c0_g1_i2:87-1505(-)
MARFHDIDACFWFGRWWTFAASFLTLLCGGTAYLYGSYSDHVKKVLNLEQNETSLLGVSFYFSQVGGIFVGLAVDYFGPRPVGWISAGLLALGYSLFRGGILHDWHVFFLSMSLVLVGIGSGGIYVATVPSNINNFNIKHKGKVVGLLVAMYGGASAIFSVIYKQFQTQEEKPSREDLLYGLDRFFIFLAAFLGIASAVGTLFINFVPKNKEEESSDAKMVNEPFVTETTDLMEDKIDKEELMLMAYPQSSWIQTFLTLDFWLLNISFTILVGAGAVYIATSSQLVSSLRIDTSAVSINVILISIFNGLSRFAMGLVSDLLSTKLSRPFFLCFIGILFAFTHAWLSIAEADWQLYIASALIGFSYGSLYILGPVLVNELFGALNWGANNSMLNMLPAGGNPLFSVVLQAKVYESHITEPGSKFCYGRDCFKATFYVVSASCMLATILAIILWARTRNLYRLKQTAVRLGLKK